MFLTYSSFFLRGYSSFFLFGCGRSFLTGWEVQLQNGFGGTNLHALATETTFIVVNESEVVFDGDGLEWTYLLALAAADAGNVAGFFCHTSLVFVVTAYVDAA